MGIQGLLEFLEKATKPFHISEFKGATAAIDAYSWLAKGISQGVQIDKLPEFCLQHADLLQSHDIRPIFVFNGKSLNVLELRKRDAEKQQSNIAEPSRLEDPYKITIELAAPLIKQFHEAKIDCLVAPYEVGAQLAFFNLRGIAELVISENPDLTLFGCSKICLNMDIHGQGVLLDSEKICDAIKLRPDSQMFDKFKHMCILSGCDYLEPLDGIDLAVAHRFISNIEDTNPETFLDSIPSVLNIPQLQITEDYKEKFMTTDAIFRHQIIFNPFTKRLEPLFDPHIAGTNPAYCTYTGEIYDQEKAYQVALGNLHPCSFEVIGDWDPKAADLTNKSIWGKGPYERSPSRSQQKDSFKEYFSNYKFETIEETDLDEPNRMEEETANQRNLDFMVKMDIYDSESDMPSGTTRFPSRQPPFTMQDKYPFGQTRKPPQTTMPTHFPIRSSLFDVQTRFPSPHIPTAMPDFQTKMPGIQTKMPGVQTKMPGVQTKMPGIQTSMPGIQTASPGIQATMPGFQTAMPASQSPIRVFQTAMPGIQTSTPGIQTTSPGIQATMPGLKTTMHSAQSPIRVFQTTLPGHQFGKVPMPGLRPISSKSLGFDQDRPSPEPHVHVPVPALVPIRNDEDIRNDESCAAGTSQDTTHDTEPSPMDFVEVMFDQTQSDQGKDESTKLNKRSEQKTEDLITPILRAMKENMSHQKGRLARV